MTAEAKAFGALQAEIETAVQIYKSEGGELPWWRMTAAEVERDHLLLNLQRFNGERTRAAKAMGVSIRTLRNRIQKLKKDGVEVPDSFWRDRIYGKT